MHSLLFPARAVCTLLALLTGFASAGTVVTLGTISQFTGPNDPNLDLNGQFAYAINFSPDDPVRTVNGLNFIPDTQAIPGATLLGPQNVVAWQGKPEYGVTADANSLEEIMHDIRWAQAPAQKLQATLDVTPNISYKLQILISGNHLESRFWDIRINGQNAVDEICSLGIGPGQTYAPNSSVVYAYEFTPTTSPMTVEMGNFFGGTEPTSADRNPIWQALTLERVYIPPTPDDISLLPTQFFPSQSASIGNFTVTDLKWGATHALAFVTGTGSADNSKFTISGAQLLPQPFNFSTETPGTGYSVRVRATDDGDAARFLEKAFAVTLAAPHVPSAVTLNATSLSSGLIAGQIAALISATDSDGFDRHTFTLVPGTGSDDNSLFTVAGNELRVASSIPSGRTSVSIRLRATDLSGLTVESTFNLPVSEPRIRINEVLAVSTALSRPLDENGQPRDWIELFNEQSQPVNLAGWHLTDDPDNLIKWTFPNTTIAPGGYLLIFASGSGATPASGPVHTNFSLSQDGEHLVLSRPDGVIASDFNPPELYPNATWGVRGGGTETGHLRTPTPGALNSQIAAAGRNDVQFSVPHGFKTAAFPLTLTATVPGSTIRYTLDGSVPTASSPVYSVPINITPTQGTTKSGARIVRAFATHVDASYSPVATQSYFFVNGIANPNTDGVVGQTNLFASIKNNATYGPLIDDALLALPAVSLVINNSTDLPYSETECSIELFDPQDGEPGFTIPAGVIRSGTTSLSYAKGSVSARFRGEYGATRLNYPVYARHPHDPLGATDSFQELRLRSGSHDTHSWQALPGNPGTTFGSPRFTRNPVPPQPETDPDAQLIRNIWIEDMQLLMGQPGKHGRMVSMFVNGNYYGIYHIQEHPDDDYMASYYPGSSDDYHFTGAAVTGSVHGSESWSTVWGQMKASLSNYTQAKRWVDVTNLADYMILSYYAGNDWDWSAQHNWSAAGPRLPDWGGWKFFQQDQDISLSFVTADCTDQGVPDGIFGTLMAHADFKVLFRDRIYKHLFHDGVLTPAKAGGYYQLRANEIFTAIVAETARWQPSGIVAPPWDRDGEWTAERNYLVNTYFPQRTAIQMNQFRARGWYPVEAPEFSQYGGAVSPGAQIAITAPAGAIYYTTDGSDPRLPGGAINPTAVAYNPPTSQPIVINGPTLVRTRARTGAEWSAINEAAFFLTGTEAASAANLTLTEIQYNPEGAGEEDDEFLEFKNTSATSPVDVSGVRIAGAVGFTFPVGTVLAPGEFIVVLKSPALFNARYRTSSSPWYHAGIRVAGTWTGSLSNGGEPIIVNAANASPVFTFAYSDNGAWPGRADGKGSSLELIDAASAPVTPAEKQTFLGTPGNWQPSAEFHGSPGYAGSGPDHRIAINEVLSASLPPATDFIELLNISGSTQDTGGWYLSDSSDDYRKYRLPAGTSIAQGAYLVLTESQFNNAADPASLVQFSLDSAGDDVFLLEADAAGNILRFADRVEFGPAPGAMTFGRSPNGTGSFDLLRAPTQGGNNTAPLPEYATWTASAFPPGTAPADMALQADPDHDGMNNLAEFSFKTPPLSPNGSPITIQPAPNGSPLQLLFSMRNDVPGLFARIDLSQNILSWDTSESLVERVSEIPQPDGIVTVTARLKLTPPSRRSFVRITVGL